MLWDNLTLMSSALRQGNYFIWHSGCHFEPNHTWTMHAEKCWTAKKNNLDLKTDTKPYDIKRKPGEDPDEMKGTEPSTDGEPRTYRRRSPSLSALVLLAAVQQFCWAEAQSMEAVRCHMMLPLQFTHTEPRLGDWWRGCGNIKEFQRREHGGRRRTHGSERVLTFFLTPHHTHCQLICLVHAHLRKLEDNQTFIYLFYLLQSEACAWCK